MYFRLFTYKLNPLILDITLYSSLTQEQLSQPITHQPGDVIGWDSWFWGIDRHLITEHKLWQAFCPKKEISFVFARHLFMHE